MTSVRAGVDNCHRTVAADSGILYAAIACYAKALHILLVVLCAVVGAVVPVLCVSAGCCRHTALVFPTRVGRIWSGYRGACHSGHHGPVELPAIIRPTPEYQQHVDTSGGHFGAIWVAASCAIDINVAEWALGCNRWYVLFANGRIYSL